MWYKNRGKLDWGSGVGDWECLGVWGRRENTDLCLGYIEFKVIESHCSENVV